MNSTRTLLIRTRAAWRSIRSAGAAEKDRLLLAMADSLEQRSAEILRANAQDMDAARGTISDVMLVGGEDIGAVFFQTVRHGAEQTVFLFRPSAADAAPGGLCARQKLHCACHSASLL